MVVIGLAGWFRRKMWLLMLMRIRSWAFDDHSYILSSEGIQPARLVVSSCRGRMFDHTGKLS